MTTLYAEIEARVADVRLKFLAGLAPVVEKARTLHGDEAAAEFERESRVKFEAEIPALRAWLRECLTGDDKPAGEPVH
ncbi:MAG: hypothetical protein RLO51_16820 [Thalassobaculum sp.]|uniref:hypothetical protein n=1 Tax=Thalassobaculum sp. TaxID=2022740 RepID=UPI0032EB3A76